MRENADQIRMMAFRLSLVEILALGSWVLTMIALPVVGWIWGQSALIQGMSSGVLMQGLAVLIILFRFWGWRRTLRTFLGVAVLSFLAEWLGSKTGFPFGNYHYTDLLQPQLAGVPLLIPVAWMMMLAPSWAIARLIIGPDERTQPHRLCARLAFPLISALAITAWDLFLDPQMVDFGFWVWNSPGLYFGIPLSNYLGWVLVAFGITWIVRPDHLPLFPLALVYTITWFLQTIGLAAFWGQPGPALAGFLGCGVFVALAWKNAYRSVLASLPQTRY